MKQLVNNDRGIALVTALLLTLISLGMILSLLYIMTQATKMSAANKRYHNVSEAAYGGAELMALDIIGNAWKNNSDSGALGSKIVTDFGNIGLAVNTTDPCLRQKLTTPSVLWTSCTAPQKSVDIATVKTNADLSFLLKGSSAGTNYKVYAKIVDTSAGNTDVASANMLNNSDLTGLVAASGSSYSRTGGTGSIVTMQHIPFVYRLEVQGEKEVNPSDKANVTVLYAY